MCKIIAEVSDFISCHSFSIFNVFLKKRHYFSEFKKNSALSSFVWPLGHLKRWSPISLSGRQCHTCHTNSNFGYSLARRMVLTVLKSSNQA